MKKFRLEPRIQRESLTQAFALATLLFLGGMAMVGPSGILAWSENSQLLEQRRQEVARLVVERDELKNRVNLINPQHADADLAGELLRSNLNVVHPDEMVMLLK